MTKQNQILVLGATGKTGRRVAERLTTQGHNVRMGSRSANPSFDWNNQDSWPAALEGIDTVYLTFQPDLAIPAAVPAVQAFTEAAAKSGVSKIVILSGRGEPAAQQCEDIVINSGLNWTVVRADFFFQNFSESFFLDPILSGVVALPRAATKVAFVDADDIADVATAALTDDKHNGKVYEVTGPRMLTFIEAVEEIASITGRNIKFIPITVEQYIDKLKELQLPEEYLWLINFLFTEVLDGHNSYLTHGVEEALGRKPRDFSDYAKDAAATGVWNAG